jgi:hypothetical protein
MWAFRISSKAVSCRLPQTFCGQVLLLEWKAVWDTSALIAKGFFWLDFLRRPKTFRTSCRVHSFLIVLVCYYTDLKWRRIRVSSEKE